MSRPEIRIDQLTGSRVILAPGRSDRPEGMATPRRERKGPEGCPFCEGHEGKTPPEIWALRPDGGEPNGPGWLVRSVPNLYPTLAAPDPDAPASTLRAPTTGAAAAFASPADPLMASARGGETDLFSTRPAEGAHEVIISSPEHHDSLADLDPAQLGKVVDAWRQRIAHHMKRGAAYVQLIVNEGQTAGASLEHSHAQLFALGFVPASVARERERSASYAERTSGGNLLLDVLSQEVRRQERLIASDEATMLICPWASRSPYEMRLIPRRATSRFEEDTVGGEMLTTALRVLRDRFGHMPALNIWLRNAPRGSEHFHWHLDIAPRLTTKAAFEMATEVDVCVLAPETAAAELRERL